MPPPGARFCPACGQPVADDSAEERRIVTVVFADLAGFTSLAEGRDPEAVKGLLDQAFGALIPVIEHHGGHVDKLIGDELMALFGAPTSHEDDPERAVRAALALAPALAEIDPDLVLRVGINTGEVMAGAVGPNRAYTVTGDTVNTAHRLAGAAQPGEILVAERTYLACAAAIDFDLRPPYRLRGRQEEVQAWAAKRTLFAPGHGSSPGTQTNLIGRRDEMNELRQGLSRAFDVPQATVLTITGEPGLGKTRLALELATERWASSDIERTIWAVCPPYGTGNALAPLAEVVRSALLIDPMADRGDQVARLVEALAPVATAAGVDRALLTLRTTQLLGLTQLPNRTADAEAGPLRAGVLEQMAWAVHRILSGVAAEQPLLVVLDDLQWAEDALLSFLARVPAQIGHAPLLILALSRDDLLDRRPDLVSGDTGLRSLPLGPLRPPADRRLLDELLRASATGAAAASGPGRGLGDEPSARLLAAAGGNPLLLEQLVRFLIEVGTLVHDGERWTIRGDLAEIGLPDEIRSLIGARLDALPPEERDFLQRASVVGRAFWPEAVAVLGPVADEAAVIDSLVGRGLLVRQRDEQEPGTLAFQHVLTRDVAYAAVALADRAQQHAEIARWLARRTQGIDEEPLLGLLAHHYERAVMLNRSLENTDPGLADAAFGALVKAAANAERHDALREADEWYRRARQLGTLNRHEQLAVTLAHGRVLVELRQFEAATSALEEVQRRGRIDAPELVAAAWAYLGVIARLTGAGDRAQEAFEQALNIWRELGDRQGEAETIRLQGSSELTVGRVRAALPKLQRACELELALGEGTPRGQTLQNLGWCEFQLGAIDAAQEHLRQAGRLLLSEGDLVEAGWCFGILGFTFLHTGRIGQARAIAENLLQLSRAQGDPWAEGRCKLLLSASLVALGDLDLAEPLIAEADQVFAEEDAPWERSVVLLVLGRIARARRRVDDARRLLREGLETSRRRPSYVGAESRLLVELAGLELDAGDLEAAESRARATVALVRAGKGDEDSQLRAQIVLARIARRRGRDDEARVLLEEVAAAGADREPTDTWRAANAELARLLVDHGQVSAAVAIVDAAAASATETARIQVQLVVAQAAVLDATGHGNAARALLEAADARLGALPIVQVDPLKEAISRHRAV